MDGALGQQRAEREPHICRREHFLHREPDNDREPTAAVFRIEGDCTPASFDQFLIRLGYAVGCGDGAIGISLASLNVAGAVRGGNDLAEEPSSLVKQAGHVGGVNMAERVMCLQLANVDDVLEYKVHVLDGRRIITHSLRLTNHREYW